MEKLYVYVNSKAFIFLLKNIVLRILSMVKY